MYVNGVIIQENKNKKYKGIDGSGFSHETGRNWYLNYIEGMERFKAYYDENIGKTYYHFDEGSFVAVCNDWNYINEYRKESIKRGIEYRILLCETEIPQPIMEISPTIPKIFLGYDYAYASGDNYSAVYNEIPGVFSQYQLNDNGLFETEEEIREYIAIREQYEKSHAPYTLESGDFIIYKLYELRYELGTLG